MFVSSQSFTLQFCLIFLVVFGSVSRVFGLLNPIQLKQLHDSALFSAQANCLTSNKINLHAKLESKRYFLWGFMGHLPSTATIFVAFSGRNIGMKLQLDVGDPDLMTYKMFDTYVTDVYGGDASLMVYDKCERCLINKALCEYVRSAGMLESVQTELQALKLNYPDAVNTVFTGHGMGGAVATVVAVELCSDSSNWSVCCGGVTLITFGSPRIGNVEFAAYAFKNIHSVQRVTHNRDPVPHYPTESGYCHLSGMLCMSN